MAKIERDIFIPYIKNLCALHILRRKLYDERNRLEYRIQQITKGEQEPPLDKPYYEAEWSDKRILGMAVGCIWALIWLYCLITNPIGESSFVICNLIFIAMSALVIVPVINGVRESKSNNAQKLEAYYEQQRAVKKVRDRNELARKRDLPFVRQKYENCKAAYEETCRIMENVYSTNVIPGQYRNIHAVMYLYEWFSKSAEDDLGMALNTFVLEQIKDKIEQVIRNQGEIILNQQMQLSLQMQSNEEQNRHNELVAQKIDRLQMTEEERNRNINMLNQTQSSLLWYAQQEYIRNM